MENHFCETIFTGEFNADAHYVPTLGFEVPLTNKPFEIWDTAGKEKHSGLREYYYLGAKKAVIMFDVRNRNSFDNVLVWLARVKKMCPGIPIMLCANKSDSGVDSVVKQRNSSCSKYIWVTMVPIGKGWRKFRQTV